MIIKPDLVPSKYRFTAILLLLSAGSSIFDVSGELNHFHSLSSNIDVMVFKSGLKFTNFFLLISYQVKKSVNHI